MSSATPGGASAADIADAGPRIEERRERQRNEARRTILDATEALMIEAGGPDFSMRRLGAQSGYSAPTVYHYFGDKDGLIDALLEERVARLAEQLEEVKPTDDPRANLRAMLLAYFDFSAAQPTFLRLMWTLSSKGESRMPPAMERVRACVTDAADRFGQSGQLGPFDSGSAGQILWGLIYGLASLRLTQPEMNLDDDLAGRALDALFLGMTEMEKKS